nr:PREDICTED: transferrin-like [Linepithema humile]
MSMGVCDRVIRSFLSICVKRQTAHLVPLSLSMLRTDSTSVCIKLSLDIAFRSAMRNIVWVILLVAVARAQPRYKFCAPAETINDGSCYSLQRGDSEVSCLRVADSAECAIRLATGEADFGVFNAEELLLTYQFYPTNILPILQLRHKDKLHEEFEFQTVAVVSADLSQIDLPPGERLKRLKNAGLCHPGFSKVQWWNDYILKHFEKTVLEKTVNSSRCQENVTVIENEVRNLRDFFGKACRPGDWSPDSSFDQELKWKYPELCELCDGADCYYSNNQKHGHYGALDCLIEGRGNVAYVALSYVQEYLKRNASYQFLCPNGNVLPLSSETPCTWLKQPWSVIISRKEIAETLKLELLEWLKINPQTDSWKIALNKIIQEDSRAIDMSEKSIAIYLRQGREIDLENSDSCDRTIRWCTISDLETNKCVWVSKAATALGVSPRISCVKANSTFQCFHEIANDRADIIAIDSNYGMVARILYGLSTVLYSETDIDKNSEIIAVVREPKDADYPVKSFNDLKNRKACFPEYGGTGWLSFVNLARTSGLISSKACDYPTLVSKFLSGACTPGIDDADHSRSSISTDISSKLCSACQNNLCAVNSTNRYYGDKGALRCLSEGAGDVAFVEAANIIDGTIDPNMYRILCKNGSLAQSPGLVFDEFCALSVTIDSEVVSRRNNSEIFTNDIIQALLRIEDWLGYRVNARRPIHIYGPFNGTIDLLFKDSTSGLVPTSSTKKTVLTYKELFNHVETCSGCSFQVIANFIFVALVALYHILSSHVH